ncbi:MAG: MaoC family dehydratase N-terminal domain-containing protein [Parasporobacterium sp.]|nr:MaoC family dehydratase N-terminal domain-containing protein [Parasporobacterium sp.]
MNTYTYEEINTGHQESFNVTVTREMCDSFRNITGDINPLHKDKETAESRGYEDTVVFGMLTASFLSTLAGVYLPGERSLIQQVEVKFSKPVFPGDELTVTGKVSEKNDTFRFIVLKVEIKRGSEKVLKGTMQIGVLD